MMHVGEADRFDIDVVFGRCGSIVHPLSRIIIIIIIIIPEDNLMQFHYTLGRRDTDAGQLDNTVNAAVAR